MMMEDERLFIREMVGILGTFSPTLKTVEVDGVVDRKWMAAVADSTALVVRARQSKGNEWDVVGPGEKVTGCKDRHRGRD